jgi:15-cis-phytoene synthase
MLGLSRSSVPGRLLGAMTCTDTSTFAPGFRLLPGDVRPQIEQLYLILRTLDDLVDEEQPQASERVHAAARWARGERADSPETRMLDDLAEHGLARSALIDFCDGMRADMNHVQSATEDELELYCQRVGGSIGVMLAQLLGASAECEAKMATLGRAAQRTNILRDIDEDREHGRVYLARSTIERFGTPLPGAREALMRDQIARADALYEQGLQAIELLPRGRRAIALWIGLYREILRQLERNGLGRRAERAVVPAWRRRMFVARHRLGPEAGVARRRIPTREERDDRANRGHAAWDDRTAGLGQAEP